VRCDARNHRLTRRKRRLRKPQREIHASNDRRAQAINVVDDPNRRSNGSLEEPIHEHFAAASAKGAVIIEVEEKIVRFIDDNNCPSCHAANRVGDEECCNSIASIGFGVFIISLSAEMHRDADLGAKRLGKFALARSWGTVEENIRASAG